MFRIGQLLEIYDEDDYDMGIRIVPIKNIFVSKQEAKMLAYQLADIDYINKLKGFIKEAEYRIELAEQGRHQSYSSQDGHPFIWSDVWEFDKYIEKVAAIGDYVIYEDGDSHPWFDLSGVPESYLNREVK